MTTATVVFMLAAKLSVGSSNIIQDMINLSGLIKNEQGSSLTPLPRDFLEAGRLIETEGYRFEKYQVVTEDGYVLELHRLSRTYAPASRGVPVFLMHGFVGVSDTFISRGRNHDLAFMLADSGYDVWLGNARGNAYSKGHLRLTRSNPAYWDFSVHEIAVYDLPALVDHVLAHTNHKRLFFVGYSMSTSLFLIMTSIRPEYNEKIILGLLMAPVASGQPLDELSSLIRPIVKNNRFIRDILKMVNISEILPRTSSTVSLLRNICGENILQPFCLYFFGLLVGQHPTKNLDLETFGEQTAHFLAGSSVDTFYQITEIIKNGLKPLDYGTSGNLVKYNNIRPPHYDLQRVTTPIVIFYSDNDSVSTEKGVFLLAERLPNVIFVKKMPHGYTHADYVFGLDNVREVNIPVMDIFNHYPFQPLFPPPQF